MLLYSFPVHHLHLSFNLYWHDTMRKETEEHKLFKCLWFSFIAYVPVFYIPFQFIIFIFPPTFACMMECVRKRDQKLLLRLRFSFIASLSYVFIFFPSPSYQSFLQPLHNYSPYNFHMQIIGSKEALEQ